MLSIAQAQIGYVEFENTAYTMSDLTPDLSAISSAIDGARCSAVVSVPSAFSFSLYIVYYIIACGLRLTVRSL